jgi:hypothetical protein
MTNYTACQCAVAIVFLLVVAAPGFAQSAPTPEQLELVKVLGARVRAASEAEVASRNAELPSLIAREKKLEDDSIQLERQIAQLTGRIEALSSVAANCPAMRAFIVQAESQANQASKDRLAQLKKAYDDLNAARGRRLEAEKAAVLQQGRISQLFNDLEYLYKLGHLDPPQYSWQAMMDYMTKIARQQQLKSKIMISVGAVKPPIKYQLVTGGQIYSAASCAPCSVDPGNYKFWVDKPGAPDSSKKSYLVFRETQSIDLNQP